MTHIYTEDVMYMVKCIGKQVEKKVFNKVFLSDIN